MFMLARTCMDIYVSYAKKQNCDLKFAFVQLHGVLQLSRVEVLRVAVSVGDLA